MLTIVNIDLKQAVRDALNERDVENGQVSGARLKELLESFQSDILTGVDERLKGITGTWTREHGDDNSPFYPTAQGTENGTPTFCDGKYLAFCYAEEVIQQ